MINDGELIGRLEDLNDKAQISPGRLTLEVVRQAPVPAPSSTPR